MFTFCFALLMKSVKYLKGENNICDGLKFSMTVRVVEKTLKTSELI